MLLSFETKLHLRMLVEYLIFCFYYLLNRRWVEGKQRYLNDEMPCQKIFLLLLARQRQSRSVAVKREHLKLNGSGERFSFLMTKDGLCVFVKVTCNSFKINAPPVTVL